ncbi:MAG TPA: hypothetical protein DCR55_08520 [Lentisphaeria bacterium]|jgi:formylglycine-generating enzyme required for sulfatase activity|nr:hypothetical protein [Lentisphaeria bacterium]
MNRAILSGLLLILVANSVLAGAMQSPWHPITLSTRSVPMKLRIIEVTSDGIGEETLVTIAFEFRDARGAQMAIGLEVSGNNGAEFIKVPVATLNGDLMVRGGKEWTAGEISWLAGADWPNQHATQLKLRLVADDRMYLVVDVAEGPDARAYPVIAYNSAPPDLGGNDEYRKTKIVLRRMAKGRFIMGDDDAETQLKAPAHNVVLSKDYYMGVYEVTQRQWERVMGSTPAKHAGEMRPVDSVDWNLIRGGTWPSGHPAVVSFMGVLRAKARIPNSSASLPFDLPTEAQWEYACRAGTSKDFHLPRPQGTDCSAKANDADPALEPLGWYVANCMDPENRGHRVVGRKIGNAWGLYDMHGNVYEWCLDWYGNYETKAVDPVGSTIQMYRVFRGGSWFDQARDCVASSRKNNTPDFLSQDLGFRVSLVPTW